jgi:hypothetical protein
MAVLLFGCDPDSGGGGGGGGGSPTGPTCVVAGDSCFVASGATFSPTDLTTFQGSCTGLGGTFTASGTCSTASIVTGYCAIPNGAANALAGTAITGMTMRGYYYTPAYDAPAADADCTGIGGTWTGGAPPASCGNGTVEFPEWCDGANLDGATCVGMGYTGGTLACAGNCLGFVTTGCTGPAPVCGDNNATAGESCDGTDLNGATCTNVGGGFTGGTLACAGNCLGFVTTGCTGGGGGGTAESEPNGSIATADGPYTADVTLTGAIAAGTPADYDYFAIQNTSGVSVSVTLSTVTPNCGSWSYDTVLTVYNSGGTTIGSNDDYNGACSQVTVSIPAGTTYYAMVRGYAGSAVSSYQLVVNFP